MTHLIPKAWDVPEIFKQRLGSEYGKQRVMVADNHLLLILHEIPQPGKPERAGLLFWRSPAGEWQSNKPGAGMANLMEFLESYQKLIDKLEADLEKASTAKELFVLQRSVIPISRSMKNAFNVFQQARDAIKSAEEIINLRDHAYSLDRASDLLQADVQATIDFEIAEQGELQTEANMKIAKAGHRLNILATLFLPLTAITSLFGMNLNSGLDKDNPIYFWAILIVGMIIGFVVKATIPSNPE